MVSSHLLGLHPRPHSDVVSGRHHGSCEYGLFDCTWNPYWVYCKFHGWQQWPACSSEIALSHSALCDSGTLPPRERMRVSYDDELSIDQNPGPCLQLEREQICITASALLDHYTRAYLIIETSHAEDIAGIQAILELLNKLAVQPQVIFPQCKHMVKKLVNQ